MLAWDPSDDDIVRPAYRLFTVFVKRDFAPHGRSEPGLWSLPNGDALVGNKFAYGWSRYSLPLTLGPKSDTRLMGKLPARGDNFHAHAFDGDLVARLHNGVADSPASLVVSLETRGLGLRPRRVVPGAP